MAMLVISYIWRFPEMGGYSKIERLFHGKSQNKMDNDWGYPHFRKPTYDNPSMDHS